MALAQLHSDLLTLVAEELHQVIDLYRLVAVCRSVRQRLLRALIPRFERAKARYGTANLARCLKHAHEDDQDFFIRKLCWIDCPEYEAKAAGKRGDLARIERGVEFYASGEMALYVARSGNLEAVRHAIMPISHLEAGATAVHLLACNVCLGRPDADAETMQNEFYSC